MKATDFDYYLPEHLIAQFPIEKRDESRLLVYHRNTEEIEHRKFYEIYDYLNADDCIVINDTKVIPARLLGYREDTGGKIEFVLLKQIQPDIWSILVKPGKRAKIGSVFIFGDGKLKGTIIDNAEDGGRIARFHYEGNFEQVLDEVGIMPLPPYIHEKLEKKDRYQTVYANERGSAAAPTAGLHFTDKLLEKITDKGVKIARITLHVGLGTFRPVKVDDIGKHKMHSEFYHVTQEASKIINNAKQMGGRVIAIGTTSVRTLETVADFQGKVIPGKGETDIFIYPGYQFKIIDGLITNFHLPKSTLIMLVSAMKSKDEILRVYNEAVKNEYRFFSFGDAMFII